MLGVDGCAILQRDPQENSLTVVANYVAVEVALPADEYSRVGASCPLDQYPVRGQVLEELIPQGAYLDDPDTGSEARYLLRTFQWAGALLVPLVGGEMEPVGLLELYVVDRTYRFDGRRLALCQALANQVAAAMKRAQYQAQLGRQRETLRRLLLAQPETQDENGESLRPGSDRPGVSLRWVMNSP